MSSTASFEAKGGHRGRIFEGGGAGDTPLTAKKRARYPLLGKDLCRRLARERPPAGGRVCHLSDRCQSSAVARYASAWASSS